MILIDWLVEEMGLEQCKARAFSPRNQVLGYECVRVFTAGAGPCSPLRDAATLLS